MYYASSYELNQYKHIKYILNEKFTSNPLHEKHRMVVYLHRINIKIIFKLLNRLTIIFNQRNVRYIKEYRQYLLNKLTKYALIIAILFSLFIYGNFFLSIKSSHIPSAPENTSRIQRRDKVSTAWNLTRT